MVIASRLAAPVLALLVPFVSCMNMMACCAIGRERFPQRREANRRAQSTAPISAPASSIMFTVLRAASFRMPCHTSRK
jgi:hypothetical protein